MDRKDDSDLSAEPPAVTSASGVFGAHVVLHHRRSAVNPVLLDSFSYNRGRRRSDEAVFNDAVLMHGGIRAQGVGFDGPQEISTSSGLVAERILNGAVWRYAVQTAIDNAQKHGVELIRSFKVAEDSLNQELLRSCQSRIEPTDKPKELTELPELMVGYIQSS